MCLHPHSVDPAAPEGIARVAKAAFPKDATSMPIRGELGAILKDGGFAHLFPSVWTIAYAP